MILERIAASTRERVTKEKEKRSLDELKEIIYDGGMIQSFHHRRMLAFEKNLSLSKEMAFICEVKRASPSKGIIAEEFPYLEIATEYEQAGATAISVLTEPNYFKGSNQYLTEISKVVNIPVLRKDFIIDEYQIYEAKLIGADAVLLICSLLSTNILRQFLLLCEELGLSALVEAHSEVEIQSALEAGAKVIGVNNRNLQTFEVDITHSVRLRNLVPPNILFVAESGIRTREDIEVLKKAGVNAVLIGETLMRSHDKKVLLDTLSS